MATAATLLRQGDVLGGFRVDDVIGIGGMAIVYRAEQISLGRPVALKVLSTKLTSDEIFRERFRRECAHTAGLEHPNIIPVYESGEQDGLLYLAMRLVEGTNLAELIQTSGLTADQAIEILRPIASALNTAHAAGLIHRDVKPQNILITAEGHPYLADFGVAKGSNTEGLTATGGFVGSINYASPEQIRGLTLTPASDIYALTAVLYQCLTGRVPFPRETDAAVERAHLHDPPPTLPACSDFHAVLARGMAKDPRVRYGHASDLVNAAALCVSRLALESRKAAPAFPGPTEPPLEASPARQTEILAADELAAARAAASSTVADRRRPAAAEPVRQGASAARMPKMLIVGIGAALAAAILATVLLAGGSGGASGAAHSSSVPPIQQLSASSSAPAQPALAALSLKSTAAVYVCLIGDNGQKLIPGRELQPGASTPTFHARRFTITLGNNAVTMLVDGIPWTVPSSSEPIGYSITKAARHRLKAGQLPTCQ